MKRILSLVLAVSLTLTLTACRAEPKQTSAETTEAAAAASAAETTEAAAEAAETTVEAAETTGYPVTVTDQAGREVTIEAQPETIVSGYYISSSILIALGLQDKLTGIEAKAGKRPIYKLAAPQLIDLPNVGSAKEFDLEGCAALKPDLIILPKKLKDAAASLEELGLKVLLVNPESTKQLREAITLIGAAAGAEEESKALLDAIGSMQDDLKEKLAGADAPRVYMAGNSDFLETASAGMYQSSMIENAGGANVAAEIDDSYWTAVSYEQLLAWNPDYIVLAAEAGYTVEDVLADANLSECSAVQNGQVYAMPCDIEAWDSPVPGGTLGSIWLASLLHSDRVSTDDYENAVHDFYGTFYGFTK